MNTKEQWEIDFDKLFVEQRSHRGGKIVREEASKIIDFIRETREQAYQKGLDDGYDEGFRDCEKGVTP